MDKRKSVSVLGLLKSGKQRKALQNPNDDFNLIRENTGIEIEQLKVIQQQFLSVSNQGIISHDKIPEVLKNCDSQIEANFTPKVEEEIQIQKGSKKIDFITLCHIYSAVKEKIQVEIDEANNAEYVDAFVALGGNQDRTGCVERNLIIYVIKEIFELTFDIEQFMQKQEVNSDQLDFTDFCTLFDQNFQESRSIISGISRKYREGSNDIEFMILNSVGKRQFTVIDNDEEEQEENDPEIYQNKQLEVNYRDFQRWLMKQDNNNF